MKKNASGIFWKDGTSERQHVRKLKRQQDSASAGQRISKTERQEERAR
jgi:hypothetical protein